MGLRGRASASVRAGVGPSPTREAATLRSRPRVYARGRATGVSSAGERAVGPHRHARPRVYARGRATGVSSAGERAVGPHRHARPRVYARGRATGVSSAGERAVGPHRHARPRVYARGRESTLEAERQASVRQASGPWALTDTRGRESTLEAERQASVRQASGGGAPREVMNVDNLWMNGGFPVDRSTAKINPSTGVERFPISVVVHASSLPASLDRDRGRHTIPPRSPIQHSPTPPPVSNAVHRFQQSIAGRPYLIEVAAVAADRWRACIVRTPGVPTALMPFYGSTPDDAARQLSAWLTRAHERAAGRPAPA